LKGRNPNHYYFRLDDPKFEKDINSPIRSKVRCLMFNRVNGDLQELIITIYKDAEIIELTISQFCDMVMAKLVQIFKQERPDIYLIRDYAYWGFSFLETKKQRNQR
jgi:hypothetical protein